LEPGCGSWLRRESPASAAGDSGDGVVIGLPTLQALDGAPGPRIWLAAEAADMRLWVRSAGPARAVGHRRRSTERSSVPVPIAR
jgi:hypothetical protein